MLCFRDVIADVRGWDEVRKVRGEWAWSSSFRLYNSIEDHYTARSEFIRQVAPDFLSIRSGNRGCRVEAHQVKCGLSGDVMPSWHLFFFFTAVHRASDHSPWNPFRNSQTIGVDLFIYFNCCPKVQRVNLAPRTYKCDSSMPDGGAVRGVPSSPTPSIE